MDIDRGVDVKLENGGNLSTTWTNRRRMAWLAFWAALTVTFCMFLISPEQAEKLETLVVNFYYFCAIIIGAYMGSTAAVTSFMSKR